MVFQGWRISRAAQVSTTMISQITPAASRRVVTIPMAGSSQRAGVREYWIVNPEDQTVQVMLLDDGGVLQLQEVYDRKGVAKVNVLDGCFIELSKVFSE